MAVLEKNQMLNLAEDAVKKALKKKETPKEKEIEKEKVDLDSLLEERGLADKKKKPKE